MNIFVGCSSRDVTDNVKWSRYCTATLEVTKFITAHKHTLVFGGCARGLMGLMYKCMLLNKANIIVAIPQAYINDAEELFYSNLFDFNIVSERKDWIFKNTSMHIFLPGGIGTIDELFSSIEAKRCGEHNSPIIIINEQGYFNDVLHVLARVYDEGFADEKDAKLYTVVNSTDEIVPTLEKSLS